MKPLSSELTEEFTLAVTGVLETFARHIAQLQRRVAKLEKRGQK